MISTNLSNAYLGLGANLGDAKQTLKDAIVCLAQQGYLIVQRQSCFYQSAPLDAPGNDYINCVIEVHTSLSPLELLKIVQKIENHFGRKRPYHHAPRTLDIDILIFNEICMHQAELTIPHPRMHQRAFVLYPLLDICPEIIIPGLGPAKQFISEVQSQSIEKIHICCPYQKR